MIEQGMINIHDGELFDEARSWVASVIHCAGKKAVCGACQCDLERDVFVCPIYGAYGIHGVSIALNGSPPRFLVTVRDHHTTLKRDSHPLIHRLSWRAVRLRGNKAAKSLSLALLFVEHGFQLPVAIRLERGMK